MHLTMRERLIICKKQLAVGEGFEPSVGGLAPTTDYKSVPINRSGNPPQTVLSQTTGVGKGEEGPFKVTNLPFFYLCHSAYHTSAL